MAAVEQRLEYKRELLAGDLLTIRSWIEEMREKSLVLVHEMDQSEDGRTRCPHRHNQGLHGPDHPKG